MALEGNAWVKLSTGRGFAAGTEWYPGLSAGRATLLGDVNGDGRADLVAVWDDFTLVMLSAAQLPSISAPGFLTEASWSGERFWGNQATLLGDVDGDGRADLVAIDDNDTWVMLSTATGFSAPAQWSGE